MATRMQQRRGTASQWTAADPVLGAGEIGFETDTGEFRVGDGVSLWSELSPFKNIVDLGGNLDDYIPLTLIGANDGVAGLDSTGQVSAANLSYVGTYVDAIKAILDGDIATAEADAISNANIYTDSAILTEVGNRNTAIDTAKTEALTAAQTAQANAETTASGYVSDHAADTTSVHGISDTSVLATREGSELFKNKTILAGDNNVTINAADIVDVTASASELNILDGATLSTAELNYVDGVTSSIQTQLDAKAPTANPTFTGTLSAADISITGDLTVGGTTTTVNATDLVVTDPLIYIGEGNSANIVDLGLVSSFNDGAYQHAGIVRDASDGIWKLFSSVEDEPTTTINFSQAVYDTLKVGGIEFSDGTQVKQGVPSLTSINQQTGDYTPVLTDRDKLIEINSSTPVTLTVPSAVSVNYPVGTSIDILQTGSGQVTIAGASNVTVNATPGLKLRTQWSSATLFKRTSTAWVVFGDLTA